MKQFLVILFSFFLINIYSQNVDVKAYVNSDDVSVGDYIQYTIEANSKGTFYPPKFENFKVISGGGTSQSSSINIVNGQMEKKFSYSTNYLLQALKKGKFTIPQAEFVANGNRYKSNTIVINVGESKTIDNSENANLFARIELNKNSAYVGEPITASYLVYSKNRPDGYEIAGLNASEGFWTEQLSDEAKLSTKTINGQMFYALELKKIVLIPQKSGKLNIASFEANVRTMGRKNFYGFSVPEPKIEQVKSTSTNITVNALPSNLKSGLVGNFDVFTEVSKTETNVDEGFDIKIKIEGTGNLNRINEIDLNLPPDLEAYEPEITENISITSSGYKGSKTFSFFIVPRAEGNYSIPEIKLDYFDLTTKTIKFRETPSFSIKVNKTQKELNTSQSFTELGNNKNNVEIIDSDIHYVKINANLKKASPFILNNWWFWGIFSTPLLAWLVIILMPLAKQENSTSVKKKLVKKLLIDAEKHLKNNNENFVYDSLIKAWQTSLDYNFNITLADWNKTKIKTALSSKNLSQNTIENILENIDNIELAKYSPIKNKSAAQLLQEVKQYLKIIEHEA
ncbi:MAG: BatD family protein [Bacteroidia bacterium]